MYRPAGSVTDHLIASNSQALGHSMQSPHQPLSLLHSPTGIQYHNAQQVAAVDMASKVDQILSMLTSTQQVMIKQQTATKKLALEVEAISLDLAEMKESQRTSVDLASQSSGHKQRASVPPSLSVSA